MLIKLNDEVTRYIIEEKIAKRDRRGVTIEPGVLRVAKANLAEHLLYFNWLFATRQWIAGDTMTLADFALARPPLLPRLSGRRRLGHFGRNPPVVRPHQVPPSVPHLAQRPHRRHAGGSGVCGPRFLILGRVKPETLITELARAPESLGFDAFGVARADARPDLPEKAGDGDRARLAWRYGVDSGDAPERRGSPAALWDRARSVVMLEVNYGPDSDPLALLEQRTSGNISVYARNRDYHELIKGKLKDLAGLRRGGPTAEVKVFVDTAPLMEKPLAEAAGIGWQGKHTVLVSREFGSWLFLGAILTDAELPVDAPHEESCGSCTRCLDICPTNAFPAPFQLDARKCLAYLNIEHKGPIPREYRAPMGNRIYGCDDCLAVCPWNKFALGDARGKAGGPQRPQVTGAALIWRELDDAAFRALFAGSPVKRLGLSAVPAQCDDRVGNSGASELAAAGRDAARRSGAADPWRGDLGDAAACRAGAGRRHWRWTFWRRDMKPGVAGGNPACGSGRLGPSMGVFFSAWATRRWRAPAPSTSSIDTDIPIAGTTRTEEKARGAGRQRPIASTSSTARVTGADAGTTTFAKRTHVILSIPPDGAWRPGAGPAPYRLLDAANDLEWIVLLFDRRRLRRFRRRMDRRDAPTPPDQPALARTASTPKQPWRDYAAARGRAAADPAASRAPMVRAARPSTSCATARRGASSSRARCSTASMSRTSAGSRRWRRSASLPAPSTSPMTNRRRRRISITYARETMGVAAAA